MSSKELQSALLNRIVLMRTRAVVAASQSQQRYKTNFEKRIKRTPTLKQNDLVYLKRNAPALPTKAGNTSTKLRPQKTGPYIFLSVRPRPKTVTIEKNDIPNTVRIVRITIAQRKDETFFLSPTANELDGTDDTNLKRTAVSTSDHINNENNIGTEHFDPSQNHADKYVVDRIVDHYVKGGKTL